MGRKTNTISSTSIYPPHVGSIWFHPVLSFWHCRMYSPYNVYPVVQEYNASWPSAITWPSTGTGGSSQAARITFLQRYIVRIMDKNTGHKIIKNHLSRTSWKVCKSTLMFFLQDETKINYRSNIPSLSILEKQLAITLCNVLQWEHP